MAATFQALPIDSRHLEKLANKGITEPTAVQRETIPLLAAGKDVIAESQPGTGKTLAYLLPLMRKLDPGRKDVQALILSPTRELAMQIAAEAKWLSEELRVQALIGGASAQRQIEKLKEHPQLVVGTPGRIAELIQLRKLKMHEVRTLIVDEADQMFELGSGRELAAIMRSALRDRQLAFFSATISPEAERLAREWMNEPHIVRIRPELRTAETVEHVVFQCEARDRIELVKKLMRAYEPRAAIVFVKDTDDIGGIEARLKYGGLHVVSLYGDTFKQDRAAAMASFREGRAQVLLATDVAARGLDLPDVSLVVHYDAPADSEQYIHRSGRTGRAGRAGTSALLLADYQLPYAGKLAKALNIRFERRSLRGGAVVEGFPDTGRVRSGGGKKARAAQRPERPAHAPKQDRPEQAARQERSVPPSQAGRSRSQQTAAERRKKDQDKNKGAPKWLKNKP